MEADTFSYNYDDFKFGINVNSDVPSSKDSLFDDITCKIWQRKMKEGHFWYDLNDVKTRILDGQHGFVLQLNVKRLSEKRKFDVMQKVDTPFDKARFNFTKAKDGEKMIYICPFWENKENNQHVMMINVCPLEFGHSLIIPDFNDEHPQKLTKTGMKMALDCMLLSTNAGFRIGYNSICALASVNHQHLHTWYIDHTLFIEELDLFHIGHEVFEINTPFLNAFVFVVLETNMESVLRELQIVVDYLFDNDIAHNITFTRGQHYLKENGDQRVIRILVMPRKKFVDVCSKDKNHHVCSKDKNHLDKLEGMEEKSGFNIAVCEMSGHVPCYDNEAYFRITEKTITDRIHKDQLSKDEFDHLKKELLSILECSV